MCSHPLVVQISIFCVWLVSRRESGISIRVIRSKWAKLPRAPIDEVSMGPRRSLCMMSRSPGERSFDLKVHILGLVLYFVQRLSTGFCTFIKVCDTSNKTSPERLPSSHLAHMGTHLMLNTKIINNRHSRGSNGPLFSSRIERTLPSPR